MDAYDKAVAYLTKYPERIRRSWGSAAFYLERYPAGILFDYVSDKKHGAHCGCLTQVMSGSCEAQTEELTDLIRADDRIPGNPEDINVDNLYLFRDWQRSIDEKLHRDPPVWRGPEIEEELVDAQSC